jgi:hypothetical protein
MILGAWQCLVFSLDAQSDILIIKVEGGADEGARHAVPSLMMARRYPESCAVVCHYYAVMFIIIFRHFFKILTTFSNF